VSGQGATYCGQVSGTGSIAATWAEPLRRFCRSLDGPVRRSFCRRIPTGRAALWTAGVRHPCRDAGRCPDRAARRPSATAALRRRCPPRCPPAGRLTGERTQTMTVPAPRTADAVGVRPPWPLAVGVGRRRNLRCAEAGDSAKRWSPASGNRQVRMSAAVCGIVVRVRVSRVMSSSCSQLVNRSSSASRAAIMVSASPW